jgi:hypothetical protein
VITGSFNWSASATQSNDEYLLVMHGGRVAESFDTYFDSLWNTGRRMGIDRMGDDLEAGDIVINEIMWYGAHDQDPDGFDEFLELRNTTDRDIRLDLWQVANDNDFVVGIPPGSILPAGGLFTILDHTMEPYEDGTPQDERSAFSGGDMVVNSFNDNRQARLAIKDGALGLRLLDPNGIEMDRAGDGGPAFAGGPAGGVVRSMERVDPPGDGTVRESWQSCSLDQGGTHVNEDYKDIMIGTPDEENSAP